MICRLISRGMIVGALVLTTTGCEHLHKNLRHDDKADSAKPDAVDSDGKKILGVDSDAKDAQPFFKNTRRSSGLSSEARDIESSLGVN